MDLKILLKLGNNSSNLLLIGYQIPEGGSLPRVMQAIWDTKKNKRIWPKRIVNLTKSG